MMLLSACGSLRMHAQAASASRDLIDATGQAIEEEAWDDVEAIRKSGIDVAAREAKLQESFLPAERAYAAAVAAYTAYYDAIVRGVRRGDRKLASDTPRALLEAWRALEDVGEAVGVAVPKPVPALVDLVNKETP